MTQYNAWMSWMKFKKKSAYFNLRFDFLVGLSLFSEFHPEYVSPPVPAVIIAESEQG